MYVHPKMYIKFKLWVCDVINLSTLLPSASVKHKLQFPPQRCSDPRQTSTVPLMNRGCPHMDAEGEPLSAKQRKKLQKLWQAQEKKYQSSSN